MLSYKKWFSLFFSCCFIFSTLFSQDEYDQNIDSLRRALQDKNAHDTTRITNLYDISNGYYYYHEDSMELALKYAQECIDLANRIGEITWVGSCNNHKGKVLSRLERLEESLDATRAGMNAFLEAGDSMKYMMLYDNLGYALADMGRYDEALSIKIKASEYFKMHSDSNTIGASLYGVGWIYMEKEEYEKALPIYRESISYCPSWYLLLGEAYGNMQVMYRELGNQDSIGKYYKLADKYLASIPSSIMLNHYEYGLAMEKFGKIDSALFFVKKAIDSDGADLKGEEYNMFKMNYARLLAQNGNESAGLSVFRQAFPYLKGTQNLKHKQILYEAEFAIYDKMGNSRAALEAYKNLQSVKNVRREEKIEKNFQEIETRYETEKKNQEIKELGLLDQLNKSKLSNRNKWLWALGLGLLGLLGLLYRIFRQKSLISKQKDALKKALEDKNILLKEIHHRVKNNLQVISSLLGLQSRYVTDDVAQQALNVGKSRVQSMSLLHQKLYTNKDLKSVNIKSYFEELIANLMSTYKISEDKISFETDIDEIDLDIDTVVPLGLITNELISNSLKHAFTDQDIGKVKLMVKDHGENIVMIMKDDGKGVPFTEIPMKTKSLGLQLIKSFSEKLEGNLVIKNDEGSSFQLTFPKKKD